MRPQIGNINIKQVHVLHNKALHFISAMLPYKDVIISHFNVFLNFKLQQLRDKNGILQKLALRGKKFGNMWKEY